MTQATVEVVTPGDRRAAKEIHEGCYGNYILDSR
jgi:hypothetical protein